MKKTIKIAAFVLAVLVMFYIGSLCGVEYKKHTTQAEIDRIMKWNEENSLEELIGKFADIAVCEMLEGKIYINIYPTAYKEACETLDKELFDGKRDEDKIVYIGFSNEMLYRQLVEERNAK